MAGELKQFIRNASKYPSPFVYDLESGNDREHNDGGLVSLNSTVYAVNRGEITYSDMHLVSALADLKFATRDHIAEYLQYYRSKGPDLVVSDGKRSEYADNLTDRLKVLSKCGMVWKFTYTMTLGGKEIRRSYYTPSDSGYKVITRSLSFKEKYDGIQCVHPIENVFGHLAVNSILPSFFKLPSFVELQSHESTFVKQKRVVLNLHQVVKFSDKTGRDRKVMIEPMRFNYNKARLREDHFERDINDRLLLCRIFIENHRAKQPYVLFVCEDVQGVEKTLAKLENSNFPYMENVLLCVDEVIYNIGFKDSIIMKDRSKGWVVATELPFV